MPGKAPFVKPVQLHPCLTQRDGLLPDDPAVAWLGIKNVMAIVHIRAA